jgi:hypothetical protein
VGLVIGIEAIEAGVMNIGFTDNLEIKEVGKSKFVSEFSIKSTITDIRQRK